MSTSQTAPGKSTGAPSNTNFFTVELEARSETGSVAARRLRRDNKIPASVYEHGKPAMNIALSYNQFIKVAERARTSQIFTFASTSISALNGRSGVVKEIQKDYIKNRVLHVDFLAINDNEELTVDVPVRCVGVADGVKNQGGILTVVARELSVRCLPKKIPSDIEIDVTALQIGNSIHARDVKLPEGVVLAGNPDETVVSVVAIRAVEEETTTTAAAPAEGAAAAAPAEGAAAAPAEGAAAAEKKEPAKK